MLMGSDTNLGGHDSISFPLLTDLPPEILLEILEHVPDEELYQLALTCRKFNDIALHLFFARHKVDCPQSRNIVLRPRFT